MLSGSQPWEVSTARAHSGTASWNAPDPSAVSDVTLTSAAFTPSAFSVLSFYHYFSTETIYDGGLVALSTDGGGTWTDAAPYFLQNGYNSIFADGTASAGSPCFSGMNSKLDGAAAFQQTLVNLSAFSGQPVQLRFQFQADVYNEYGALPGWFVDDVQVLNGCGGLQQVQLLGSGGAVLGSYQQALFLLPASSPLPVELVAFAAVAQGRAVQLSWRTASELNSARFEVERSADGLDFRKLGEVAAAGRTATPRDYAWLDARPLSPRGYYRLRQVDQNGAAAYSPVRAVALGTAFAAYPVPARAGQLLTVAGLPPAAPLEVLDALGRRVTSATAGADGTATLTLPRELAGGVYVVRGAGLAQRLVVE